MSDTDNKNTYSYSRQNDDRYGLASMKWYGWGSPVGLGIFLVCIGGLLYELHMAGLVG